LHASDIMCLYATGGRDDAKVSIPATVVLRHLFTLSEMRVSLEPSVVWMGLPLEVLLV
jgi:hypothetical protein